MDYKVSSRDYLARARKMLDKGSLESLFYASFELRCGVEARMQEYLEAQKNVSKKKKSGWKIAKLAKSLEKAFKSGDKIIEIKIVSDEDNFQTTIYYTPVSSKLNKLVEKLGEYRHCMKQYKAAGDEWWNRCRKILEETYLELEKANEGILLGPPMVNKKTGQGYMTVEMPEESKELMKIMRSGKTFAFEVKHLRKIP